MVQVVWGENPEWLDWTGQNKGFSITCMNRHIPVIVDPIVHVIGQVGANVYRGLFETNLQKTQVFVLPDTHQ